MYLKVAMDRNQLDGADTKQIAGDLDVPVAQVNTEVEKLEVLNFAHVDKRTMEHGKPKDMVVHITQAGIQYLSTENGIPL
jgi:hypothetical protein